MLAEEEVILWVTSDLCSSSSVSTTPVEGTVSASAIPVTLIRSSDDLSEEHLVDTIQYEESKEDYCVMVSISIFCFIACFIESRK